MGYSPQVAALPQRSISFFLTHHWAKTAVLFLLVGWLYFSILLHLMEHWRQDENFSHGSFVPVFSLFVLWRERSRFSSLTPRPSTWGLAILILAMGTLIVGVLGSELFLSRVSFLLTLAGLIVFFRGWGYFRVGLFPWAFLFLMVPIPAIIFNHITLPLQILASEIAATLLPLMGVPVLREGNIINLPSMPLEVVQACSGIRSLLSLVTLAIIYGYLTKAPKSIRGVLALAAVPIAVVANSLRIVCTGMLAQYWEPAKAEGFFHSFSGWLVFLVSLVTVTLLHSLLRRSERLREAPVGGS